MLKNSIVKNNKFAISTVERKSKKFALTLIKMYQNLTGKQQKSALCKQLLQIGTSVGADVKSAIIAQSEERFFTKMNVAYGKANEAEYWLNILIKSKLVEDKKTQRLLKECVEDCEELIHILSVIVSS